MRSKSHIRYFYSIFLVSCLDFGISWSLTAPEIQLTGKSYILTANLLAEYPWNSIDSYQIEEIHSNWQHRSRVEYEAVRKSHRQGDIYTTIDESVLFADEFQAISVRRPHMECIKSSHSYADEMFNFEILKDLAQSSIIGPSRFLHFAQSNHMNSIDKTQLPGIMGDKAGMTRYDYMIPEKDGVFYSLYYFEAANKNLPHGVPAELVIVTKANAMQILSYTFKRIQIIPDEPIYGYDESLSHGYIEEGDTPLFDKLAIPLGIGCSNVLDSASYVAKSLQRLDYRFSFKAEALEMQASGPSGLRVGYEPAISTLRVDRYTSDRQSALITNFAEGRNYHIIKQLSDEHQVIDYVMKVRANEEDSSISCVITRVAMPKTAVDGGIASNRYSLGEVLFGGEKFVAIGTARVRGIETRVYEAFDCSWPIWIQQPQVFHESPNLTGIGEERHVRLTTSHNTEAVLNIIIYMTHPSEGEETFEGKPVMIEIKILNKLTLQVLRKLIYQVYDFKWDLSSMGPSGPSLEEFFSIGDSCAAPTTEDNHYGHLELLLQSDLKRNDASSDPTGWLKGSTQRNLAIMRVAQEALGLPASMVYDIESRLMRFRSSPISDVGCLISVPVSMRLIEHKRSEVQLIFLQRAIPTDRASHETFLIFTTSSFQTCYLVAAHQKIDTIFGYDANSNKCYLYKNTVMGTVIMTVKGHFESNENGPIEVYRLRHMQRFPLKGEDEITALARSHQRGGSLSQVSLVDPNKMDGSVHLEMQIKFMNLAEVDTKDPYKLDEIQEADTNKFRGFGLSKADRHNRLIEGEHLHTNDWLKEDGDDEMRFDHILSDMTFGQCQAECLLDFECEAFSTCVHDGKVECVLSRVSFKSSTLILQILQMQDKKARLGEKFNLYTGVPDETIEIKRHPACELHNKVYKDLFEKPLRPVVNLNQRRIHPVSNVEQCAKICVKSTIEHLRSVVKEAHKASLDILTRPEYDVPTIKNVFLNYKYSHLELCSSFLYFGMDEYNQLNQIETQTFERLVVGKNDEELTNGFCVIGEVMRDREVQSLRSNQEESDSIESVRLDIAVEQYYFDFRFMFERQHGTSLVESSMDENELDAYKRIMRRTSHEETRDSYEVMKLFLEKGGNIGYSMVANEAQCARTCFMQFARMWPGCKSFDVIEVTRGQSREVNCFFNSITAREALLSERFDLVRAHSNEQAHLPTDIVTRVVHFEPKSGFSLDSLALASRLEALEGYIESNNILSGHFRVGNINLFLTVFVALSFGIAVGIKLGRTIVSQTDEIHEDVENLVEAPILEFKNLVNFEGVVAGEDKPIPRRESNESDTSQHNQQESSQSSNFNGEPIDK